MAKIERFEDLMIWQKARELSRLVCGASRNGAFAKDFGLRDQIRSASISIMSNVAEGFERGGDKEFLQFLSIAKGSCGEVRAQLYVALDLEYISSAQFDVLAQAATEVSQLLSGFMKYLRESTLRGSRYR